MWRTGTRFFCDNHTNDFLSIIYVVYLELYDGTCELLPSAVHTEKKMLGSAKFMV